MNNEQLEDDLEEEEHAIEIDETDERVQEEERQYKNKL